MLLEGQRVVVTGASRGIGRAIALACAREGAEVGVHAVRSTDAVREVVAEIERVHARRAHPLQFDVRDDGAIGGAIDGFVHAAGGLDALVNNAGVNLPDLLATASTDRLREQLEVNLLGPMLCARAALPHFLAGRRGVIVNVGSVASARPVRGQSAYAASKGGLEALTRALAVEYARKSIRVHCVRAGAVDTAMLAGVRALAEDEMLQRIPMRRLASAGEIAELVVFLLSARAGYITGSTHTVDGGYVEG